MTKNQAITSGVILPDTKLRSVLKPIPNEAAACYWLMSVQSSSPPFREWWRDDREKMFDQLRVDVTACYDTGYSCWRKGTLPAHADDVALDEWTYLYGLNCNRRELPARADRLMKSLWPHKEFFGGLDELADIFVMYVDGWWEVYSPHRAWTEAIHAAVPGSRMRSIAAAGEHPHSTH